jgi:hypothetical protein
MGPLDPDQPPRRVGHQGRSRGGTGRSIKVLANRSFRPVPVASSSFADRCEGLRPRCRQGTGRHGPSNCETSVTTQHRVRSASPVVHAPAGTHVNACEDPETVSVKSAAPLAPTRGSCGSTSACRVPRAWAFPDMRHTAANGRENRCRSSVDAFQVPGRVGGERGLFR